jgi:hypothetical protein
VHHVITNDDTLRWSHRYQVALQKHLNQGTSESLRRVSGLGRQAAVLGMKVPDVAKIHKSMLAHVLPAKSLAHTRKRADIFCADTIIAIKHERVVVRKTKVQLNNHTKSLGQHSAHLAKTNRTLQRSINRSIVNETALMTNSSIHAKMLEETPLLHKHLRDMTHRLLLAQEDERMNISHELQNEIAQTLLGINVRLLSLKNTTNSNTREFRSGIASTQKLVLKSARSVRQFAHELDRIQSDTHSHNDALMGSGVESFAFPDTGKGKQRVVKKRIARKPRLQTKRRAIQSPPNMR